MALNRTDTDLPELARRMRAQADATPLDLFAALAAVAAARTNPSPDAVEAALKPKGVLHADVTVGAVACRLQLSRLNLRSIPCAYLFSISCLPGFTRPTGELAGRICIAFFPHDQPAHAVTEGLSDAVKFIYLNPRPL